MSFSDLTLHDAVQRALADAGYDEPTPIQAEAIPPAAAGRDVFGCAQTGTGKTAAFVLPILHRLATSRPEPRRRRATAPRVLILTPTRELAGQIGESIATYGKHLSFSHTVIYGGVGQGRQVDALKRGCDLLVACPGRLLDLMGQGHIDLRALEFFVLDEADRMLDMGFIHDVRRVTKALPDKRQTLFFSATVPKEIRELADSMLQDPVSVTVTPTSSTAETIDQSLYFVAKPDKIALLKELLRDKTMQRVLVFSRTKHGADRIAKKLVKQHIATVAIHGNKSQNARQRALDAFKNGKARVLVASDIAARGIDIDDVTHVVNYELPHEPETYVHRIGRTGRAGRGGVAISFCEGDERKRLQQIQKLIKKQIPVVEDHAFVDDLPPPAPPTEAKQKPSTKGSPQGNRRRRGRRRRGPHGGGDKNGPAPTN